ncbi:MAG TPA: hypothetical protein VLX68_11190 [Chitinivibrionales bacterium]|nr:hypothetical protein [Chitinivibrionales bacterium]
MRLSIKIAASTISFLLFTTLASAAIPPGYTGKPFCCDTLKGHYQQIPGQIVAVLYDSGGEGVAFHYPGGCGNGSTMRQNAAGQTIAADKACMQPYETAFDYVFGTNPGQHATGYWHLAWIDAASTTDPGEWVKFSVHVNTAGTYYVGFHEANAYLPNLQTLTYYNGTNVKIDSIVNMAVDTPLPSGCPEVWHSWSYTPKVDSVALDTGLQVIQMTFKVGSWNFDWMQFDLKSATGTLEPAVNRRPENDFGLKTGFSVGVLTLSYAVSQPGGVRIFLTDCAGKTAWSSFESAKAGLQTRAVNVGKLRQGVYFISVEQNGLSAVKSIIINR